MTENIFNTEAALERLGGNKDLYKKLLGLFIAEYQNMDEVLWKMVDSQDIDSIQRYVHTVKGVAGNLGADNLFKVSEELNLNLKQGEFDSHLLEVFIEELNKTVNSAKSLSL